MPKKGQRWDGERADGMYRRGRVLYKFMYYWVNNCVPWSTSHVNIAATPRVDSVLGSARTKQLQKSLSSYILMIDGRSEDRI
jgi:hypothetical protein